MTRPPSSRAALLPLCMALLASPRVAHADDKADCIASFDAAQSHRLQQKLTKALAEFASCSRDVCPASLKVQCVEQGRGVRASLPTVVFGATDAAGHAVIQVKVTIDGLPVTAILDGKAITLDPGIHAAHFETAGAPPVDKPIVVAAGQQNQSITVTLGTAAVLAPPPAPLPAPALPTPLLLAPDAEPQVENAAVPWSTQRKVGIGVGAVGVGGLVLGGVFGAIASSKWASAKSECGATCPQFQQAVSDQQSASTAGTVSTAAFIVGGVAVATGTVLWLTAPKRRTPAATATALCLAPAFGSRTGSLVLRGGF